MSTPEERRKNRERQARWYARHKDEVSQRGILKRAGQDYGWRQPQTWTVVELADPRDGQVRVVKVGRVDQVLWHRYLGRDSQAGRWIGDLLSDGLEPVVKTWWPMLYEACGRLATFRRQQVKRSGGKLLSNWAPRLERASGPPGRL